METKQVVKPKLFVGIDIHKRSWKIQLATDLFWGKGFSTESDPFRLKTYVDKHYSDYEVYCAYEAGCCGYSAHRTFKSFGWHSIVVNPADISRTNKLKHQKTDKIDAKYICRELKDGRLTGITVPEVEREQLRCLFRRRFDLVKDFRKVKSKLKAILLYLGIKIPEEYDNPNWSHGFRNWIRSQNLKYHTGNYTLASQLEHYEFIDKQIRLVSIELRKSCRKHYKKDYDLLQSIPGIGPLVACGILSELGDLRRFSNFKQFASYVGMIPSMQQSGESRKTPGMTPRANRIMRTYFVQATWQALRFDPVMQEYFRSHKGKEVNKILVKVARKLMSRTLAVIKTETPYATGIIK